MVKASQFLLWIINILVITEYVFSSNMVRICYFNAIARYRKPNVRFDTYNIDFSLCSHYVYAHARISADCMAIHPIHMSVETFGIRAYHNFTGKYSPEKRSVKTLVSIGGPNDTERSELEKLTSLSESGMEIFSFAALKFLRVNGFDGLDIDFAYPPAGDIKSGFVQLLRIMREVFDNKHLRTNHLITVKLPPIYSQVADAFNVPAISTYADYISVAAYNLPSPNSSLALFSSPLYATNLYPDSITVNSSVQEWLDAGLTARKTVLGITPVGRFFRLKDPNIYIPGSPIHNEVLKGNLFNIPNGLAFPEVCDMSRNASRFFDLYTYMDYLRANDTWVGYEEQTTILHKVQWAHDHDLAGVMLPAVDMDDFKGTICNRGTFPLLKILKEETERSDWSKGLTTQEVPGKK